MPIRMHHVSLAVSSGEFEQAEQLARALHADLTRQNQGESRRTMRALNYIGISQIQRAPERAHTPDVDRRLADDKARGRRG